MPRTQAPLIAVLSNAAGDHPATLFDVSGTGARLCGQFLPAVGQQMAFRAEDVRATVHVIWSTGQRCGVEFETPLSIAEVDGLRRSASRKAQFDSED